MAQSDQTIQNNTGANVRADINSNLAALYSLSSGASQPSTTVAHQLWLDTSTSPHTLRIRNASNNGWIALGNAETNLGLADLAGATFTGNVLIPAGTEGAAGLGIAGDTDTGLYKVGANDLGITAGGTLRTHVNSNGLTIRDGKGLRLRDSGNSNYVELKAPALTSDVSLTLPTSDGSNGDMLQTNGSGVLSWQSVQGVPTGSIFCIAHSTIPGGYLECNGAQHLISVHGALSNVLGTTWNNPAPDSGYFRVPDLRGEFIRGADNGRNVDMVSGSSRSPFSWQGDLTKTHTHTYSATTNQQGDHNHWVMYNLGQNQGGLRDHAGDPYAATAASYGTGNDPRQDAEIGARSGTAANAGQSSAAGAHSHTISGTTSSHDSSAGETRPRNVSMIYIIKT